MVLTWLFNVYSQLGLHGDHTESRCHLLEGVGVPSGRQQVFPRPLALSSCQSKLLRERVFLLPRAGSWQVLMKQVQAARDEAKGLRYLQMGKRHLSHTPALLLPLLKELQVSRASVGGDDKGTISAYS